MDLCVRVVNTGDLCRHELSIVPIKVEDDELGVDGGHEVEREQLT